MSENAQPGSPDEGGRAAVSVYADGRLTGLNVHVREDTGLAASDYPAEGRMVLRIGDPIESDVSVFMPVPVLAALIDVLNESYTRLTAGAVAPVPSGFAWLAA